MILMWADHESQSVRKIEEGTFSFVIYYISMYFSCNQLVYLKNLRDKTWLLSKIYFIYEHQIFW